jgi:hypothetical protein
MKGISLLGRVLALVSLTSAMAQATILFDTTTQLIISDSTQLGRLSRNGILQDWVGSEPFPGVINPTTTYRYHTFSVDVGGTGFIQIDFDSVATTTFVSAYQSLYLPNSAGGPNLGFDTNWLGDAGTSGNFFGVNPLFFNVIAQPGSTLVVVVNETTGGTGAASGIGKPFHLTVEGFYSTDFSEVPEPSSVLLCFGGVAALVGRRAWRRASARMTLAGERTCG